MKWSTHITEFENLLPKTGLQVEKALRLYEDLLSKGQGRTIIIAGERGSGRSEALMAMAESFSQKDKNLKVISGRFTDGKYLATSAYTGNFKANADAVGNSLSMLAKVVALASGVSLEVVLTASFLFDFIGQLLQTSASVQNALDELSEKPPNVAELPNTIKKLLRAASKDSPIICLLDDFDEARYEWHEFLDGFAEEIEKELPILFFVTLKGKSEVGEHHKGETNLEMVTRRSVSRGLAEWWYLKPMTRDEISDWIGEETQIGLVSQLHGVTGGLPRWVKELWRDWKARGLINYNVKLHRWDRSETQHPTLNPFNDVLKDLIVFLLKTDDSVKISEARELLATAALEGLTFTAESLALATDQDHDDLMNFLDNFFVQSEENPSGILLEEGFLTFEVQPESKQNVFLYRFVSDWHWQVLDRYALTEDEKMQKSDEMITALEIVYEGNEPLIARSLAKLYRNIGDDEESNHFETIASYASNRELMFHHAQRLMQLQSATWDKFQCYQNAKFLLRAGKASEWAYPLDETIKIFEFAEEIAVRSGDLFIQADAMSSSGFFYQVKKENAIARDKALKSKSIFEKLGMKVGISKNIKLLAEIDYNEGDNASAKSNVEAALKIDKELELFRNQAICLRLLAQIAHDEGDNDLAKRVANQAISVAERVKDREVKAKCLLLLAQIADAEKEYEEKRLKAEDSLRLFEEIGDKFGQSAALKLLTESAYSKKSVGEAASNANLKEIIAKQINHGVEDALGLSALVALHQGDYEVAKTKINEGVLMAEKSDNKELLAGCQILLGLIALEEGNEDETRSAFESALRGFGYDFENMSEETLQELLETAKTQYDKDEGESIALIRDLFKGLIERAGKH